jgi:hypothetical protein
MNGVARQGAAPSGVVTFLFTDIEGSTATGSGTTGLTRPTKPSPLDKPNTSVVGEGAYCVP